jgi:glutaminyl-peptide cyclotransferase
MQTRRRNHRLAAAALAALGLVGCEQGAQGDDGLWFPEVVARYPHDPNAFTQGLLVHDGKLYESTGREGLSSIRLVEIETGRVERRYDVDQRYFGEGLALVGDRLYQLTWQNNTAFVYDVDNFNQVASFEYEGEGWGLAYDGRELIMSDGSPTLRFIDPADFSVVRTVTVTDSGRPLFNLNELEYIDGEIWANIWYDDRVVRIDPDDGRIIGWIDLGALYPASARPRDAVVNGIAWDKDSDRIFVTGKLWPAIFEIRFSER